MAALSTGLGGQVDGRTAVGFFVVGGIGRLARKAFDVGQKLGDQPSAPWIPRFGRIRKETKKIARLLNGIRAAFDWHGCQHPLQGILSRPQGLLVGVDLDAKAPQLGRFLGGHIPAVVEFDAFVRHRWSRPGDARQRSYCVA